MQIVIAPHVKQAGDSISVTGPERRAANLACQWKRLGINPVICYPNRGNLWGYFKSAGLDVIDFEIGNKFNLFAPLKIWLIGRKYRVDLIHTQGPASLDLLATFGAMLFRVPLVITRPVMIEDQVTYSPVRRKIYSIIDRILTLKFATRIIAVSGAGLTHLRRYCNVSNRKSELIYNGIAVQRFASRYHQHSPRAKSGDNVVIGMVAQLFPPKGWPDFIEVVERLRNQGENVRGIIVGEGVLRSALEAMVAQKGLTKNIEFTGFRDDVSTLYQRMDIFLFTSQREGLSVAIIEALASGLPIVATDVGGIREQVIDGQNGYVVRVGDIESMVQRCTGLIGDEALRQSMGRRSREIAEERFCEERMLEQYAACYRAVCAANAA